MPVEFAPRQHETEEVTAHVIWMTTGLSCDGDSVGMTSATNPSLEDIITGAIPASANTRYISVSVMLSGCAGQPGMFTIGMLPLDFQLCPRWSHRPIAPVGLFFIAGMPP